MALPSAAAFTGEHEALSKLCSRSLRPTTSAVKTGGSGNSRRSDHLPCCALAHRRPCLLHPVISDSVSANLPLDRERFDYDGANSHAQCSPRACAFAQVRRQAIQ